MSVVGVAAERLSESEIKSGILESLSAIIGVSKIDTEVCEKRRAKGLSDQLYEYLWQCLWVSLRKQKLYRKI